MNICILGWYGTETLGDRSILDGIIKIFESYTENNSYFLGSLIPFFSERTIYLDKLCYADGKDIKIDIFCEKDETSLKHYIQKSDFVIMGGGPIMDINEIFIIRKAFKYAKKKNIKTGLIGCGYGPFHNGLFESVAKEIVDNSDVVILRDELSNQRVSERDKGINAVTLSDPAVISALCYREKHLVDRDDYIAINFRDTRFKVYKDEIIDVIDDLYKFTCDIASGFTNVKLVPMHTFFWGGDDRRYFAEMFQDRRISNVKVVFEPQNIYELYHCFSAALGCVGMRYHSVVLQTILNGNNIILDYTEEKSGKISGFLKQINSDFYTDRYVNIGWPDWISSLGFNEMLKQGNRYKYMAESKVVISKYIKEMFD